MNPRSPEQLPSGPPSRDVMHGAGGRDVLPLPATVRVSASKGPLIEIAFRRANRDDDSPRRQAIGFLGGLALASVLGVILFLVLST